MLILNHPALGIMLDAVAAASRVCRAVQEDLVLAQTVVKGDRSPVTVADFASQAVVARILGEALPDVPLVGEEDAALLRDPANRAVLDTVFTQIEPVWPGASEDEILSAIDRGAANPGDEESFFTLDPIDGTKGFLRGDQYAVALALITAGRVTVGVLGCPNLEGPGGSKGAMFAAVIRKGTAILTLDRENPDVVPVRVSGETDPARIRFCESVEKAHSHQGRSAQVAEILGVTAPSVGIDSQCKYALVARGDAELYLRIPRDDVYREKIWDHAAGAIVVTEAGGTVTDVNGKPLDFTHGRRLEENRGVVASNGPNHEAVLGALRETA